LLTVEERAGERRPFIQQFDPFENWLSP